MRFITILFISTIFCTLSFAQLTVELTVLSGAADSNCRDVIGAPDHLWEVKVNDQDWTTYQHTATSTLNCAFASTPNLQFRTTASCPSELEEIEVCFRAFENDSGIFDECGISPSNCIEEICSNFPAQTGTYTLTIPGGRSASGNLRFEIQTIDNFIGDANDLPCMAINLGEIGASGTLGDVNLGIYNNYCGTFTFGEPNPTNFRPSWTNNLGTWYSFTTTDEPIHRLEVHGKSDPENTGDPIHLQIGIFESNTCDGTFEYLVGSPQTGRDRDGFDETITFDCSHALEANTTYYVLIDGVDASPETLNGIFGLEVNALPLLPTEINETLCFGESLAVLEGLTYSESGVFRDTLRLSTGCDTIIHANIQVLDAIEIELTQINEATNEGAADGLARVSAIGGAGAFSFLWSDGNREPTNGNLVGGETASVTVTDANGCEASASLFVEFIRPLMPIVVADTLNCFGDSDGIITLSVMEGRPPYNFAWSDASGEQNGSGVLRTATETAMLSGLRAGDYSITISDNISEDVIVTASILQPEQLQISMLENQRATCFGLCDARLEIDVTGGILPYDFSFSRGDFDLRTFTNLCAGNFQLTVTDANNCVEIFDIEIEEPAEFIATAEIQNVSCFEGMDGTISISSNGNPNVYTWSNGANSANLEDLAAGQYNLTVSDENGCEDELELRVEAPTTPLTVEINQIESISCFGKADGVLEASVSGPFEDLQYTWSNRQSEARITQLAAATYSLSIENEKACTATDSFTLTQADELRIETISTQDLGCAEALQFGFVQVEETSGGTMPYEYSLDGIRFSPSPLFDDLQAGTYSLIVRDAAGCERDTEFSILPAPILEVNLGADQVITLGESLGLEAFSNGENLEYTWQGIDSLKCDNCASQSFTPLETRTYRVEVFDPTTQCTASDAITIAVRIEEDIYLPNAFSPNGDGMNDFFTILSGPSVTAIRNLQIFDRRGHLVYETPVLALNQLDFGWDGKFRDEPLPTSVFTFLAQVEYIDGRNKFIGGEFSLIR